MGSERVPNDLATLPARWKELTGCEMSDKVKDQIRRMAAGESLAVTYDNY